MKKKIMALLIAGSIITMSGCGKTETSVELQPSDSDTTRTEATTATDDILAPILAYFNETDDPAVVQTEETETQETDIAVFKYFEKNGEITITDYVGESDDIVFPATIDGKPVTKIGYIDYSMGYAIYASVVNGKLKSAVIPEGVTTIEAGAFHSAQGLVDLIIPESVTNFGYDNGLTPFNGSLWLENKREENPLVIVNNIVIDGQKCTRSLDIPDGVTEILGGAFKDCTTITSVTLPKSLEKIGDSAFENCSRLTSIDIPDSVYTIGERVFNGCAAITGVTLPKSLEKIGASAFENCSCLMSIDIPDSVCTIEDKAFYGCEALEDVTFPDKIVEMGEGMFERTPWLKNKRKEKPLVIIGDNLIDACECTGDVVVPNNVKSIADSAFRNTDNWFEGASITSVELPNGIKKIPDSLFCGCHSLKNVTIPDSVTEIGNEAFLGCDLKNVTLPNSVTEIGAEAFFKCSNLESVMFSEGITIIGEQAFYDCNLTNVIIPNSVEIIGNEAFCYCYYLESATLSDNLTSLGKDAFGHTECDITYKGEIYFPELYGELYEAINGKAE